jgi:hypothetical protein
VIGWIRRMVVGMAALDDRIGDNVARLRGDLSQRAVAQEMKRRGWKWSHVTLVTIESGERPLRLSEAVDLANVLHTDVRLLFEPTGNVALHEAMTKLDAERRSLESAVHRFALGVVNAVSALGDVELAEDQEQSLREAAVATALDVVHKVLDETPSFVWDDIRRDVGLVPDEYRPRLERTAQRLEPVATSWNNDRQVLEERARGLNTETS